MRLDFGRYRRFLLFATVCMVIAGCAESGGRRNRLKKMIPASGAVTYKGQPIQGGTLTFSPVDPVVSVAATAPIIDGRYQTEPGSGLTAGDYKVVVTALDINAMLMAESKFRAANSGSTGANRGAELRKGSPKATQAGAVPQKYSDYKTTDLLLSIESNERKVEQDFNLED